MGVCDESLADSNRTCRILELEKRRSLLEERSRNERTLLLMPLLLTPSISKEKPLGSTVTIKLKSVSLKPSQQVEAATFDTVAASGSR